MNFLIIQFLYLGQLQLPNFPIRRDKACCGVSFCKNMFIAVLGRYNIKLNDTRRIDKLQIYLVGGAVRDQLLGLPVHERDWVVVGSSPEEMQAQGFKAVGKDFPVFLHPETKEEYALARTERKTGRGYKGFTFYTDPNVTLEQDLIRRDLTINAIAEDDQGNLIDPFNGQADLKAKKLQHVSDAFSEDPVRILRIARFAAKLPEFSVTQKTNQLMQDMVNNGEVGELVSERVWQELRRSLGEAAPHRFFEVLDDCSALASLFPELKPELFQAQSQFSAEQNFALLMQPCEPDEIQPFCRQHKVPRSFSDLAKLACDLKTDYEALDVTSAEIILQFIKRADGLRRRERFFELLAVLTQITGLDHQALFVKAIDAVKSIDVQEIQARELQGEAFAQAVYEAQLTNLSSSLRETN